MWVLMLPLRPPLLLLLPMLFTPEDATESQLLAVPWP